MVSVTALQRVVCFRLTDTKNKLVVTKGKRERKKDKYGVWD